MLFWPQERIPLFIPEDKIAQAKTKIDVHLVFEYAEGDTILGGRFRAPRSNRFYFVHDPNGGKLRQLEPYHKILEDDH